MMLEGLEPGAPPALGGASSPVDGGALAAAAGPPAPGVPDVAQKVFSSLLDDEMAGVYERGIRTPQVRIPGKTHLSAVLLIANPWEARDLERKLSKIRTERVQKERTLEWNQRQFFINQIFDQDLNLRFNRLLRDRKNRYPGLQQNGRATGRSSSYRAGETLADVGGGSGGVGGGGSFHSVPSTVLGGTVGGLEMVPLPPASAQLGAGYGATLAAATPRSWNGTTSDIGDSTSRSLPDPPPGRAAAAAAPEVPGSGNRKERGRKLQRTPSAASLGIFAPAQKTRSSAQRERLIQKHSGKESDRKWSSGDRKLNSAGRKSVDGNSPTKVRPAPIGGEDVPVTTGEKENEASLKLIPPMVLPVILPVVAPRDSPSVSEEGTSGHVIIVDKAEEQTADQDANNIQEEKGKEEQEEEKESSDTEVKEAAEDKEKGGEDVKRETEGVRMRRIRRRRKMSREMTEEELKAAGVKQFDEPAIGLKSDWSPRSPALRLPDIRINNLVAERPGAQRVGMSDNRAEGHAAPGAGEKPGPPLERPGAAAAAGPAEAEEEGLVPMPVIEEEPEDMEEPAGKTQDPPSASELKLNLPRDMQRSEASTPAGPGSTGQGPSGRNPTGAGATNQTQGSSGRNAVGPEATGQTQGPPGRNATGPGTTGQTQNPPGRNTAGPGVTGQTQGPPGRNLMGPGATGQGRNATGPGPSSLAVGPTGGTTYAGPTHSVNSPASNSVAQTSPKSTPSFPTHLGLPQPQPSTGLTVPPIYPGLGPLASRSGVSTPSGLHSSPPMSALTTPVPRSTLNTPALRSTVSTPVTPRPPHSGRSSSKHDSLGLDRTHSGLTTSLSGPGDVTNRAVQSGAEPGTLLDGAVIARLTRTLPEAMMLMANQNMNRVIDRRKRRLLEKSRDRSSRDAMEDERWRRLTASLSDNYVFSE